MVHVVVIDDEPLVVEACAMILRVAGFQVSTAPDGESGLQLIRTLRPAVVVSDIRMPGLTGDELAAILKAGPETHHIPILLMSAHGSAPKNNCDGFLAKPFLNHELIAAVQRLVPGGVGTNPSPA